MHQNLDHISIEGKQYSFKDGGTTWFRFVDAQLDLNRRTYRDDFRVMVEDRTLNPVEEDVFLAAAAAISAVVTVLYFKIPSDKLSLWVSDSYNPAASDFSQVGWVRAQDMLKLKPNVSRRIHGGDAGPWIYQDGWLTSELTTKKLRLADWIVQPQIPHCREHAVHLRTIELNFASET